MSEIVPWNAATYFADPTKWEVIQRDGSVSWWDAVRLPGIASGSESSVMKVLDEHERIKARDEREP
jgi:hypothetical protein